MSSVFRVYSLGLYLYRLSQVIAPWADIIHELFLFKHFLYETDFLASNPFFDYWIILALASLCLFLIFIFILYVYSTVRLNWWHCVSLIRDHGFQYFFHVKTSFLFRLLFFLLFIYIILYFENLFPCQFILI